MTRQETGQIMDILATAYPEFYNRPGSPDMGKTIKLWASMFQDDPLPVVAAAVKALIVSDVKGYPPKIGQIKEKIGMLTTPDKMTEMEAWNLVANALRNSAYGAKEEYDKLPPDVQKLVGSPNQLREWAMMDIDELQSVVASNFQRSYRVTAKRKADFMALPSDVRNLVGSLSNKLALEG